MSLAFAVTASCSVVSPTRVPMDPAQIALQGTSQQPAPPSVPVPAAPVTRPWMEEQFRKLDDRYAAAAADTRAVFEQSLSAVNNLMTPAHLGPLRTSVAKIESQLSSTSTRTETLLKSLETRVRALERSLAEATAERDRASLGLPIAGGSLLGQDPDQAGYLQALNALQGTPRQTLPLRSWLEIHPAHPKASEALLQLGIASLDSGYPTAARYYFTRVIDHYGTSAQAHEAKAFMGYAAKAPPKRIAKPSVTKSADPPPSQAGTKPDCTTQALCAPDAAPPAAPAPAPTPAVKVPQGRTKAPTLSPAHPPISHAVPQSLMRLSTDAAPLHPEAPARTRATTSNVITK